MTSRRRSSPRTTARDAFRMTVAAHPGVGVSLVPELDLVKAALLYGDTVRLLSPVTTMLLRVERLPDLPVRRLLELVRRLAPVIMDPAESEALMHGLPQLDELLRASERRGPGTQALRVLLNQQLRPLGQTLANGVEEITAGAGLDQLERARAEGLVTIDSADPGGDIDLLVHCVTAAKLAESDRRPDEAYTDRIVERFVETLAACLFSDNGYLIFDEPVASLAEAAIREGLFSPAPGPAGRSAQAMAASAMMARLPTFPGASVDEVLDVRRELDPALARFRAAMVRVSRSFTSEAWERSFEDELRDAWVGTVLPAITDIEDAIHQNGSILSMAAGVAGTLNAAFPGLAIVGTGVAAHAAAVQFVGGAIAGVAPLLTALQTRRAAIQEIGMQPFYFLYAAERALAQAGS
jgi:hypothetical protein